MSLTHAMRAPVQRASANLFGETNTFVITFDVKLQQQHSRHDEKTTTHWTGTLPCAVRLARFHAQPVWHVSMRRPSDDTQDRIANTLVGVASPLDMQNRIASTLVGVA